jgi:hypothetical protein
MLNVINFYKNLQMKKLLFVLVTLITISCSKDLKVEETVNLEQFYSSVTIGGKSRIVEWKKLSLNQKHSLWEQRLNNVALTIDNEDKMNALKLFLKTSFTLENYSDKDMIEKEYFKFLERNNELFSDEELRYIFETIDPYSRNLEHSLKVLTKKESSNSDDRWGEDPVGPTTFADKDCDCAWGDCGGYFNDSSECCGEGGCVETVNGCGLVWLGQCTSYCIDTNDYECIP